MDRWRIPAARPGMTVGLLGGSFDPPHGGHVHITREALKRFGLDRVWWLVSPGNPLKAAGPAPIGQRIEAARALLQDPRVTVTDIEAVLGTRFTAETLDHLVTLYDGVRFVWLMGADNLADFHRWQDWERIFATVPIGVMARPGLRLPARISVAAGRYERARLPEQAARALPFADPPAWCLVNLPMVDISSTEIRAQGAWQR